MSDLAVLTDKGELTKSVTKELVKLEAQAKAIEERRARVMEAIKVAMEANGVKKYENDNIAITYIEPGTRVTFDSKALKDADFETYTKYVKESETKASVRIRVK